MVTCVFYEIYCPNNTIIQNQYMKAIILNDLVDKMWFRNKEIHVSWLQGWILYTWLRDAIK